MSPRPNFAHPTTTSRCRLHRREISFSQGAEWKALISKYIGTMPPTGNAFAAEQSGSSGPPPTTAVSSAMIAKVGAAASDCHLTIASATAAPSSSQLAAQGALL
ncbi:hypothetical protein [Bradyrhizobium sp. AZCC 1721]|uniref:hypothetical protein n=1 Tax=Bradyrhizobium sp. AZCC 1721 TaxID=3117016 RepID=UPI00302C6A1F